MHELTKLIKDDQKPALGVTEPGAIAFITARALSYTEGEIKKITLFMNSGMYKNAFTCGIPGTHKVGNVYAAALGAVAGDWEKGLEALANVTKKDNEKAQELIDAGKVEVKLSHISSDIYMKAVAETENSRAEVTIRGSHTHICEVVVNGEVLFREKSEKNGNEGLVEERQSQQAPIHRYSVSDFCDYIENVDIGEIAFLKKAYDMNLELYRCGLASQKTTFLHYLRKKNGDCDISGDALSTAQLLCNGAIEARVLGLDKPAMSITGSGAHGIICTMPLYAWCEVNGLPEEKLLRSTALSYLITMYIKEYSGKLSAFCGCAIAAGTGMACALTWLMGGGSDALALTIRNMASGITGMICDGGNHGCTMKGVAAVDAAFRSAEFAIEGLAIGAAHGINGATPEQTMHNMGLVASPGMVGTEKTIVEIMEGK